MRSINNINVLLAVGILLVPFSLFSCVATTTDVYRLNDQLMALKSRVDKLEASVDKGPSGDIRSGLKSVRETQAETAAEMDKLRGEIQDLRGDVEKNTHLIKKSVERDITDRDLIRSRVKDLKNRVAALERQIKQLHKYLDLEPAEKSKEEAKGKPPSRPSTPEKPVSQEKKDYESIRASYKKGNYEEAIRGFKELLEKYPDSEYADNAQFWIGESYMALQDFEQAILAYQKVINKYPQGNKIPNAMLRQAVAFYKIEDNISAKVRLKNVIEKYPGSREAKIAKEKLEKMK